jgi:hypothetical protein
MIKNYLKYIKESKFSVGEEAFCVEDINSSGNKMNITIGKSYKVLASNHYHEHIIIQNDTGRDGIYSDCYFEFGPEKIKKREDLSLKMSDVDPYGEEDWLRESLRSKDDLKDGDIVRVKSNFREWIEKENWIGMTNLIGKRLTVDLVAWHPDYNTYIAYFKELEDSDMWIPISCLDLWPTPSVKKKDNNIKWYNKGKLEKINIKL